MTGTNTPTDILDAMQTAACTCANLRKATRLVTQAFDDAFRPLGLKAGQFTLLATLANLGDTPLTKLANALVMDRTTLTRNLKPLVDKSLVAIEQEDDQRVRMIRLTEQGRRTFDEARPLWETAQARLVAGLGSERWAGMLGDLRATVVSLQEE